MISADDHDAHVLGALADDPQRVEERGEHDDRRAVLVVVEDRDLELVAQAPLDLEAARRGDVLEVHAAERRRDHLHETDDLVDVLGVHAQRERVDVGELLEEHRLALHHRHRRVRPDVAEAEHRAAVGDDRDAVGLDRQRPRLRDVLGDRHAHPRDPRRVGHRQVVARLHRRLRHDLDLAAHVQQERPVGDRHDLDLVQRPHRADHGLAVRRVRAQERDVADHLMALHAHQVDRAQYRPGVADRARHPRERSRPLRDPHPDRDAVRRRRLKGEVARRLVHECSLPRRSDSLRAKHPTRRADPVRGPVRRECRRWIASPIASPQRSCR
jgi:hypothetical protein